MLTPNFWPVMYIYKSKGPGFTRCGLNCSTQACVLGGAVSGWHQHCLPETDSLMVPLQAELYLQRKKDRKQISGIERETDLYSSHQLRHFMVKSIGYPRWPHTADTSPVRHLKDPLISHPAAELELPNIKNKWVSFLETIRNKNVFL